MGVSLQTQRGRMALPDSLGVLRTSVIHPARGGGGGGELLSAMSGAGAGGVVSTAGERGAPEQTGERSRYGPDGFNGFYPSLNPVILASMLRGPFILCF